MRTTNGELNAAPELDAGDELASESRPAAAEPHDSQPVLVHPSTVSRDDADLPHGLRIAAAWSWRLLVIGLLGIAVIWVVGRLRIVLIPLAIALLLSALLAPAVGWLLRARFTRSLATAVVLVGGIAAVAGTLTLVITQFIDGVPDLTDNAGKGIRQIQDWLQHGPLHLSDRQLESAINQVQNWVTTNRETLTSGAIATAATVFEVITGALLVLFATFFFLRDGRRIWRFVVRFFPSGARTPLASAGEAAWGTLAAYVRATVLVAFIDAVGIGLALLILRVPLAFPLAALVFLGAFIPIIGATLSGTVAVLVALVGRGPVIALLVLAAVIAIQQLEGHVLQPLIMGRAVAIHPLAVIVAIATGVVLAGIIGALVAVPIVAVLNTGVRRLIEHRREPPPKAVVVSADPAFRGN
ncbi:MAG TPA: AI-2E family transporter [Micromonosporaceae bacterium]|jgi:predicted PurR-regulated permease PerM